MAVEPLKSGVSDLINALFSLRSLRSLLVVLNAVVFLLLLPTRRRKRTSALKSEAGKDEKHEGKKKGSVGTKFRVPAAVVPRRSTAFAVDLEAAGRRSLAIRRVVEDDDGVSMREFSLVCSARGDTLFIQSWSPISVKIRSVADKKIYRSLLHWILMMLVFVCCCRGVVILMHGLNEHRFVSRM